MLQQSTLQKFNEKHTSYILQQIARKKLFKEKIRLKVFVDRRERSSDVAGELEKWGLELNFKHLLLGDYIVSSNCIIERKSFRDFCSSLLDGRLFEQAGRLSSRHCNNFLIVENWKTYGQGIHPHSLLGSLLTLSSKFKISVLQTYNTKQTAHIIYILAFKEQFGHKENKPSKFAIPKQAKSINQIQLQILSSVPNLGPKQAKMLLQKFENIENLINVEKESLLSIKGIGKRTVESIRKVFKCKYRK